MLANRSTVFKAGAQVFDSVAGQFGMADYANRDFICFPSPIAAPPATTWHARNGQNVLRSAVTKRC
ncbi:hypothetical protein SAMN02982985_02430 [Rugamonas rubra]|uniref:Uncharacterized protein n=1 Tax=Rugamonas rubra TaxID=758825 RepID=A0A1I4MIG2_9BURK|nr:hypothetical protein SAMN02982985_02430 [Rugamonas rubra]